MADKEAVRLAKISNISIERFVTEIVEAELAAGRTVPSTGTGQPRLAGSSSSVEPVSYRLNLPR